MTIKEKMIKAYRSEYIDSCLYSEILENETLQLNHKERQQYLHLYRMHSYSMSIILNFFTEKERTQTLPGVRAEAVKVAKELYNNFLVSRKERK